jgi:hypothetical protein
MSKARILVLTFWETKEDMDAFYQPDNMVALSDLLEKLKPSFEQLPKGRIIKWWLSLKYSSQAVITDKTNFGLG